MRLPLTTPSKAAPLLPSITYHFNPFSFFNSTSLGPGSRSLSLRTNPTKAGAISLVQQCLAPGNKYLLDE